VKKSHLERRQCFIGCGPGFGQGQVGKENSEELMAKGKAHEEAIWGKQSSVKTK